MTPSLIRTRQVSLPLEEALKRLRAGVAAQGLVLVGEHDLKKTLVQQGSYIKGEYCALEIGYVGPIKELLESYPNIVSLLPGRICAWGSDGKTTLSFLRPAGLAKTAKIPARHRKLIEATCRDFEQRLMQLLSDLSP